MIKIAKIVKSNSHVDYVGRVIDRLDADEPPGVEDYGFAQFVSLPVADNFEVVGVVYDFQDAYSGRRGQVHVINVDGETDVEALRDDYPEIESRIERLWSY